MYTVTVRDHMMIAHSLRGEIFGQAQRLHGATYVIDVEFRRLELSDDATVVDIGRASATLRHVLSAFNYRNLDQEPSLAGCNTTTESLARIVFDRMADAIRRGDLGIDASDISSMRVVLQESHVARASYEGSVGGAI